MTGIAVLSDLPASCGQDQLHFSRYVDPLVALLASPDTGTPFTIGVLGDWGSGKSSVLTMVDERLRERSADAFVRVSFNPWVYRREPNLLQPLLRALRDAMLADPAKRFQSAAMKMTAIIGTLTADALLGAVSAGRITVDKLAAARKQYAEARSDVDGELHRLRTLLRNELAGLDQQRIRAVFFIDDLDRCEPDQMIDLLESIKLFLDVPGVFVLMALSKELVDRAVAVKYHDFGFDEADVIDIGDEYLEKMIQLPLYLLPLDTRGVEALLRAYAGTEMVEAHGELLRRILTPNPRKIKRVLNLLAFVTSIVDQTPSLAGLNRDLLVRLTVLRVQAPRLFSVVLRHPAALRALDDLYHNRVVATESAFGEKYPNEGSALFRAVGPHYRRQPFLEPLFDTDGFATGEARLTDHLTLFGGQA